MVAVALVTGLFIGIFVGIHYMDVLNSMMPEFLWIGMGVIMGGVITSLSTSYSKKSKSTALVKKE